MDRKGKISGIFGEEEADDPVIVNRTDEISWHGNPKIVDCLFFPTLPSPFRRSLKLGRPTILKVVACGISKRRVCPSTYRRTFFPFFPDLNRTVDVLRCETGYISPRFTKSIGFGLTAVGESAD